MSTPFLGGNKTGGLNGYLHDFYGNDFTWFLAFVEETYTAEKGYDKLNRVKIRIWGLHDFNAPIDDLPLAQVLMPTTVGGVADQSSIFGLEMGAQVMGFWLDRHKQHPVVIGSLVGKSPTPIRETESDIFSVVSFGQLTSGPPAAEFSEAPSAEFDPGATNLEVN